MMKILQKALIPAAAVAVLALYSPATQAGTIQIQLSGLNLSYDGSAIYDAGASSGGNLNPAQADPLVSVAFLDENNVQLGPLLTSNVSLDAFIPDVTNISSAPNTNYEIDTPGNPGFFDLLIGTSPLASQYLALDLGVVNVRYFDVANLFQFTFGAAIADIGSQNLPYGLVVGDPVTVSFSAQVSNKTIAGDFIASFQAGGTGEIRSTLVPEPTAAVMLVLGSALGLVATRRNQR